MWGIATIMTNKRLRARVARILRNNGVKDFGLSHKAARIIVASSNLYCVKAYSLAPDNLAALRRAGLTDDGLVALVAYLVPDDYTSAVNGLTSVGVDSATASVAAALICLSLGSLSADCLDDAGYFVDYVAADYDNCYDDYNNVRGYSFNNDLAVHADLDLPHLS